MCAPAKFVKLIKDFVLIAVFLGPKKSAKNSLAFGVYLNKNAILKLMIHYHFGVVMNILILQMNVDVFSFYWFISLVLPGCSYCGLNKCINRTDECDCEDLFTQDFCSDDNLHCEGEHCKLCESIGKNVTTLTTNCTCSNSKNFDF